MKKIALLLSIPIMIFSCGDAEQDSKHQEKQEEQTKQDDIIEESVERRNVLLPSPLQIGMVLNNAGLSYEDGLTHDVSRHKDYMTSTSKWLNFGVYSADMAYCVINEQSQPAMDIMKVIKDLGEDLGLQSIFSSEDLLTSFENNLNNRDSLIYIITTIQEELDEYSDKNDMQDERVIAFTGAWVEFVYLGTNVVTTDDNISIKIMEQMVVLENIINGLEAANSKDSQLQDIHTELVELQEYFNSLIDEEEDEDMYDLEVNEEILNEIKTKIEKTRNLIIQ